MIDPRAFKGIEEKLDSIAGKQDEEGGLIQRLVAEHQDLLEKFDELFKTN